MQIDVIVRHHNIVQTYRTVLNVSGKEKKRLADLIDHVTFMSITIIPSKSNSNCSLFKEEVFKDPDTTFCLWPSCFSRNLKAVANIRVLYTQFIQVKAV